MLQDLKKNNIGQVGKVFANGPGDLGSSQVASYQRL